MRLDDLDAIIASTNAEQWNVIYGAPTYLNDFELGGTADGEPQITHVEQHPVQAVYREDVDVRIAWGFDPDRDGGRSSGFFSDGTFFDEQVRRELGDIFYRGSLVDRFWLLSVDGGRCVLPQPSTGLTPEASTTGPHEPDDYERRITQREVNFARLVDGLTGNREFDDYLGKSGFVLR